MSEQTSLQQLASCKHCDKGDPPVFLDIDGTNCKVSSDTLGELCHASGEYWWPCPRWRSLVAAHSALVEAARSIRLRHKEKAIAANFTDCGCDDCAALLAAIALAEPKELEHETTTNQS